MSNLRAKGVIRAILEPGTMEHNVVLMHRTSSSTWCSRKYNHWNREEAVMSEPPYRALRILLRMFSLLGALGGWLMIFAEKPLIARIFLRPPEGEVFTLCSCRFSGRHGTHARRSPVARFTRSSTECGHRGRSHCRALHSVGDTAPVALDDRHSQCVSGVPLVGRGFCVLLRGKGRGSVAFLRCVLVMCGEWGNGCTMPDVFEGNKLQPRGANGGDSNVNGDEISTYLFDHWDSRHGRSSPGGLQEGRASRRSLHL